MSSPINSNAHPCPKWILKTVFSAIEEHNGLHLYVRNLRRYQFYQSDPTQIEEISKFCDELWNIHQRIMQFKKDHNIAIESHNKNKILIFDEKHNVS